MLISAIFTICNLLTLLKLYFLMAFYLSIDTFKMSKWTDKFTFESIFFLIMYWKFLCHISLLSFIFFENISLTNVYFQGAQCVYMCMHCVMITKTLISTPFTTHGSPCVCVCVCVCVVKTLAICSFMKFQVKSSVL